MIINRRAVAQLHQFAARQQLNHREQRAAQRHRGQRRRKPETVLQLRAKQQREQRVSPGQHRGVKGRLRVASENLQRDEQRPSRYPAPARLSVKFFDREQNPRQPGSRVDAVGVAQVRDHVAAERERDCGGDGADSIAADATRVKISSDERQLIRRDDQYVHRHLRRQDGKQPRRRIERARLNAPQQRHPREDVWIPQWQFTARDHLANQNADTDDLRPAVARRQRHFAQHCREEIEERQ
ncbi:MAG: hypothetical protein JMDDDDMK_01766 [Acidobacteria bacterium]|nr:hypothetical protein [Acidobacteriota bacterium]